MLLRTELRRKPKAKLIKVELANLADPNQGYSGHGGE